MRKTMMVHSRPSVWLGIRGMVGVVAMGVLAGCGSVYKGAVDNSGLGAEQYKPAVYVEPGNEVKYAEVLGVCREVAQNREMTAAQEAQLKSLTGALETTVSGAAVGAELANVFKSAGYNVDRSDTALAGAAIGLAVGLASSFASGAGETQEETKRVLLNCLNATSQDGLLWQVLE